MKRQKQYLHLLMDREGPVTSREMALETGVSLRTVKTDMAKLNELLKDYDVHIMSKPGAGYRLVPNDGGGLKPLSLLMEQMQYERFDRIPDTGPERVEYIARKLLALDYYITMEELRQILYVSRSTLNQDMRQVRRLLELYGLKVVHASHKGIRLQGTETALRRCMAELFFRDDGKWEKAPGTGHGEERISQIQQILKSRADALRVSYPEAGVRELALQIYIAAQRCRFRKEVEFDSSLQVSRRFMDMAVSISDGLRETMGISMPDIEIHNMACMLQFRSLKEEAGTEDVRFDGVIRKMFQRIEEKFGLHFSGEQQLSHYLKLHLPRMAQRCRNRILIENPVLNDTFCNYPLAVDVANVAVQVLERELDIKVNSNEFGYLAVYFNMCIVTYGERQNKTLILVCPGSRAEAVTEAAWCSVAGEALRSSVTAAPMVMDMLVPVSPSGTGNTFRSLMACLCAVMAAAPWSTICLNTAPVICSFIGCLPPSQRHGIHAHVHRLDGDAGVFGDDIAHLVHDGAAHSRKVDAVFHNDVELYGNGIVVMVGDVNALAHGFAAQQVHQSVGHGAVCHALDAEAVGGGNAGDVGKYGAADGDLTLIRFELNHENVLSFPSIVRGTRSRGLYALQKVTNVAYTFRNIL